ncbi:acyltransferase family protein [Streptomyces sp. NRRL B-24484]|uniref:acyltransferase family protein n=1 Tax=Streptomyces sp. NRRL B-24484 TaxID=1463833 RepID=UPI000693CE9F|nr:acyltransferase [Streptomyces sp. NRRL B-24484]
MRKLTHAEYLGMRRFDALDGLRAFAAVIVVLFHFAGPRAAFLSGWIGVHVFFVVSGFLITTLMLRERDRTGRISLRDFYLRRIFRIVPLYYVVLAATVATQFRHGGSWRLLRDHLPHYATFLNEYDLAPGTPFLHSWTIGIEQKFYLVWPLALILAGAVALRLRIPVALLGIAVLLVPFSPAWESLAVHYAVLMTGALLALVLHSRRGFALLAPLTHPVAGAVVGAAFVLLHLSVPRLTAVLHGQGHTVVVYGVGVALLLPSLLGPGAGRWLLSRRPLVFVGERSYGLYLVQVLAASAVFGMAPELRHNSPLAGLVVASFALLAADVLYHRVEQPMIALGRRLIRRLDDRGAGGRPTPPVPEAGPAAGERTAAPAAA